MSQPLTSLRNIGPTVRRRLEEIGIHTRADLERVGAIEAYKQICANYPDRTIAVCYYLYSLHGALLNMHWDDLPAELKDELYAGAKGRQRGGSHERR